METDPISICDCVRAMRSMKKFISGTRGICFRQGFLKNNVELVVEQQNVFTLLIYEQIPLKEGKKKPLYRQKYGFKPAAQRTVASTPHWAFPSRVEDSLDSNPCLDWEIPVHETDGKLLRIDLVESQKFQGIIDAVQRLRTEIMTLSREKSVIPKEMLPSSGRKIFLRLAIGPSLEVKLVNIPLSLWWDKIDVMSFGHVHAAIVEGLHEEVLITFRSFRAIGRKEEIFGRGKSIGSIGKRIQKYSIWRKCI
ncbi:hypothetical protein CEXT_355081 [Caerostris extrusa]|uniref:Uncharacterized protein n=1 Tax=Caerostris extrusa TaxID=172846 RepID=A0AAV4NV19_CAEEX|nr:hypothetical protein CEXT_355081 [Caerostris extrusa]